MAVGFRALMRRTAALNHPFKQAISRFRQPLHHATSSRAQYPVHTVTRQVTTALPTAPPSHSLTQCHAADPIQPTFAAELASCVILLPPGLVTSYHSQSGVAVFPVQSA
jgi:hypothetical protein